MTMVNHLRIVCGLSPEYLPCREAVEAAVGQVYEGNRTIAWLGLTDNNPMHDMFDRLDGIWMAAGGEVLARRYQSPLAEVMTPHGSVFWEPSESSAGVELMDGAALWPLIAAAAPTAVAGVRDADPARRVSLRQSVRWPVPEDDKPRLLVAVTGRAAPARMVDALVPLLADRQLRHVTCAAAPDQTLFADPFVRFVLDRWSEHPSWVSSFDIEAIAARVSEDAARTERDWALMHGGLVEVATCEQLLSNAPPAITVAQAGTARTLLMGWYGQAALRFPVLFHGEVPIAQPFGGLAGMDVGHEDLIAAMALLLSAEGWGEASDMLSERSHVAH